MRYVLKCVLNTIYVGLYLRAFLPNYYVDSWSYLFTRSSSRPVWMDSIVYSLYNE